jgi:heme exporter protein C
LLMAAGFALLFATLLLAAMRNEILRRRLHRMHLAAAETAPGH